MLTSHRESRLLLTLIAVTAFACPVVHAQDPRAKTSFGAFGFAIPAKWSRVEPDRAKTAAMLLLNGTRWDNADAMIKVDVGKPAAPSAKDLAKALAGKDGKVYPNAVSIDGTEGVKVETTSTDMSRPKFGIVIFRDGKAYLIMAAHKRGTDVSDALEHIIKSWKWMKAD